MKEGSLVVVRKNCLHPISPSVSPFVKWLPKDDEETIYTIKLLKPVIGGTGAILEEGVIGFMNEIELAIEVELLIELQAPGEVNVEEIVEEATMVLV